MSHDRRLGPDDVGAPADDPAPITAGADAALHREAIGWQVDRDGKLPNRQTRAATLTEKA